MMGQGKSGSDKCQDIMEPPGLMSCGCRMGKCVKNCGVHSRDANIRSIWRSGQKECSPSFGDMLGVFKRMGGRPGGGHNRTVGEDGKSEV